MKIHDDIVCLDGVGGVDDHLGLVMVGGRVGEREDLGGADRDACDAGDHLGEGGGRDGGGVCGRHEDGEGEEAGGGHLVDALPAVEADGRVAGARGGRARGGQVRLRGVLHAGAVVLPAALRALDALAALSRALVGPALPVHALRRARALRRRGVALRARVAHAARPRAAVGAALLSLAAGRALDAARPPGVAGGVGAGAGAAGSPAAVGAAELAAAVGGADAAAVGGADGGLCEAQAAARGVAAAVGAALLADAGGEAGARAGERVAALVLVALAARAAAAVGPAGAPLAARDAGGLHGAGGAGPAGEAAAGAEVADAVEALGLAGEGAGEGVVGVVRLCDDGEGVGAEGEVVVAEGQVGDVEPLAVEEVGVPVGPAGGEALHVLGVARGQVARLAHGVEDGGARLGAEEGLAGGEVQQLEADPVAEVGVAVAGVPGVALGVGAGEADEEVGVAAVEREGVEAQQLAEAGDGEAAGLEGAVAGVEGLPVDEHLAEHGHQVHAHGGRAGRAVLGAAAEAVHGARGPCVGELAHEHVAAGAGPAQVAAAARGAALAVDGAHGVAARALRAVGAGPARGARARAVGVVAVAVEVAGEGAFGDQRGAGGGGVPQKQVTRKAQSNEKKKTKKKK